MPWLRVFIQNLLGSLPTPHLHTALIRWKSTTYTHHKVKISIRKNVRRAMFSASTQATAQSDPKAGLHGQSLMVYSTLLKHSTAFKPRKKEQQQGNRANPWIQKVNLLTAAFPGRFASFPASKAGVFTSDSAWSRSPSLPRLLVFKLQSSRPAWKKAPKTHTSACSEKRASIIAQKLSKNPRLRLG